ncbi:unnamed protein product [Ixodes hexagonus]
MNELKTTEEGEYDELIRMFEYLCQDIKYHVHRLKTGSGSVPAFYHDADDDEDKEAYIISTLKNISKTLKEKYWALSEKIRQKVADLKEAAAGVYQAQKIKTQLKSLRQQLSDSVQDLKRKVQGFFDKGQYASLGEHAIEIFGKIVELRDRLNAFVEGMKDVAVDKLKEMQEFAKQLRKQINVKVKEFIRDSNDPQTALYHASDKEDNGAYVIATLKDISRTLKAKFLVLVERLKQKFAELKQVGREHAEKVKEQIQILKGKVADAREDLKKKVQEVFKPAQYACLGEHAFEILAKLNNLREKLQKFLENSRQVTGEELDTLRELIKETRQEIKKRVQELLGASSDTTALYHATDDTEEEDDNDVYVIAILKDISRTLKEKFLILVEHLKQKYAELKEDGGQHDEKIKGQIEVLKEKVADAREGLVQKVQELDQLGQPGQYASFGEHAMEVFAKPYNLREKLSKFLENVKQVTGEKLEKLRELIKQTRQEIKKSTALYRASDVDEDAETYIIDTLKDISKSLKKKFLVLGEKIAQKVQEIKEAAGQRVEVLKRQLQELKGQLGEAAGAMKKKILEMVQPGKLAQYGGVFDNTHSAISEKLTTLRNRLRSFLKNVQKLAGEKWIKMQETIRELRDEIKQSIRRLLHGKSEMESTVAPDSAPTVPLQY